MVNQNNFFNIFKKIFEQLSPRRKFVIIIFCFLSIITAFTEVASISILIPFADVLLDPQRINFYLSKLDMEIILNIDNLNYYTLSITLAFISIIIISSLMKFILGYLGHIIAFNVTHDWSGLLVLHGLQLPLGLLVQSGFPAPPGLPVIP